MSLLYGCESCEHFTEVELKGTPHNWRRYCGLGNFNIDLASFEVVKTSHGKNRYQRENIGPDGLEYHRPKRCPLLKKGWNNEMQRQ
jgi:hypothetical protein